MSGLPRKSLLELLLRIIAAVCGAVAIAWAVDMWLVTRRVGERIEGVEFFRMAYIGLIAFVFVRLALGKGRSPLRWLLLGMLSAGWVLDSTLRAELAGTTFVALPGLCVLGLGLEWLRSRTVEPRVAADGDASRRRVR
jgi:hypothetical protein